MWTRKLLKDNAKQILRRSYAVSVAVCALAGAVGAGLSNRVWSDEIQILFKDGGFFADKAKGFLNTLSVLPGVRDLVFLSEAGFWGISLIALLLFATFFGAVFYTFVSQPLVVGKNRAFLENRLTVPGFSGLLFPFKNNYLRVVGGMFTTKLLERLPMLALYLAAFAGVGVASLSYTNDTDPLLIALIVLGLAALAACVVLEYRWRLVPWLLAENPALTGSEARRLSAAATNGEKWNIFVLDLSFFGWQLLAVIPLGWGFLLLNPYIEATNAELYCALRAKMFSEGICTEEQLPGVRPADGWPQPQNP